MALAALRRASRSLVRGVSMEPLVSTTSTTAFWVVTTGLRPPLEITLITACTSSAPSAKYSFW